MFVDGVVSITLERDDIHVKLPRVNVNVIVVPDLVTVVNARATISR